MICLRRKTVDRCRVSVAKFEVNVGLRIPDGIHLIQQLLGISGASEAHRALAIEDLNRTMQISPSSYRHDDFERRFGLARLRVLCFDSHLRIEPEMSLDPENTPRNLIESSLASAGFEAFRAAPVRSSLLLNS